MVHRKGQNAYVLIIIKTSKLEFLTIIKSSARLFVIVYYDLQNKNKNGVKNYYLNLYSTLNK